MKKKNELDKNIFTFQDINSDDKTIILKIFRYFYSLFQERKEFNPFLKYIQLIIEAIQLISYAFTDIHNNSWEGDFGILEVTKYLRLSPIIKFCSNNVYFVIFYLLIVYIHHHIKFLF